jgi:hypothetical protein
MPAHVRFEGMAIAPERLPPLQRRILAGFLLWCSMAAVAREAARSIRSPVILAVFLRLASPALSGSVRCQTYPERTLGRLQMLCDDGTRAVSTYNRTLERWDTAETLPRTYTPATTRTQPGDPLPMTPPALIDRRYLFS